MEKEEKETIDQFTHRLEKSFHQRLIRQIQDRVALILIPRAYMLWCNDAVGYFPITKWKLCRGTTWANLYTITIEDTMGTVVTLELDNPFSTDAVFVLKHCLNNSECILGTVTTKTANPPKKSLLFLAARAMVKAWNDYDDKTQTLICQRTLLDFQKV